MTPSTTPPLLHHLCTWWTPSNSSLVVEKQLGLDRAPRRAPRPVPKDSPLRGTPVSAQSSTWPSPSPRRRRGFPAGPWPEGKGAALRSDTQSPQVLQGNVDFETADYETVFYPECRWKIYESDSTWGFPVLHTEYRNIKYKQE